MKIDDGSALLSPTSSKQGWSLQKKLLAVAGVLVIALFVIVVAVLAKNSPVSPSPAPVDSNEYDIVIIGGGTAGSVLAYRLTENPKVSVLILEGGGGSHLCTGGTRVFITCYLGKKCVDGPDAQYTVFDIPEYDRLTREWGWGNQYTRGAGKYLGGSGVHNGMAWYRGKPEDFDILEPKYGIVGWNWSIVKEFYKKSESYRGPFENDTDTHNLDGLLRYSDQPNNPDETYLQQAAAKLGYPIGIDLNGEDRNGFGHTPWNIRNGRRDSAAKAFLCPAMKRPNLEVRTYAEVTEVLFERTEGTKLAAVGARYLYGEDNTVPRPLHTIRAKAVVMSAGAMGSPYILMRSGLGNKTELEALNITVLLDVPGMGRNQKDDLSTQMQFRLTNLTTPPRIDVEQGATDLYDWITTGGGNLIPTQETGFLKRENSSQYDIMVRRRPESGNLVITLTPPAWENCNLTLRKDTWGLNLACAPVPDEDIEELAYAIETLRKIADEEPLLSLQTEVTPGPDIKTRDEIKTYLKAPRGMGGFNHLQGTARMGREGDLMAVIDDKQKMFGVENLWVADNSIFPWRLQGDAQADAVLAGERGADFIIKHFNW